MTQILHVMLVFLKVKWRELFEGEQLACPLFTLLNYTVNSLSHKHGGKEYLVTIVCILFPQTPYHQYVHITVSSRCCLHLQYVLHPHVPHTIHMQMPLYIIHASLWSMNNLQCHKKKRLAESNYMCILFSNVPFGFSSGEMGHCLPCHN